MGEGNDSELLNVLRGLSWLHNLNATSTSLLTYIDNLTNPSTLNVNNSNVSETSKLNGSTTLMSSLNVSGNTTLSNNTTLIHFHQAGCLPLLSCQ